MTDDAAGGPHAVHGAAAARELIDIIDEDGEVIGTAARAEVREQNLRHRSVFIVVVTSADELVVHQRADWKDIWPSCWDVGFGGVVDAGESFDDAAVRELAEEAGIQLTIGELELLVEAVYEDDLVRERGRVYLTHSDGPFAFDDGEVVADDRIPLADVGSWAQGRALTLDSEAVVLPLVLRMVEGGRA
jgi:8-oxo-dGTP pyrophosphatase MutT (NUDIX family)